MLLVSEHNIPRVHGFHIKARTKHQNSHHPSAGNGRFQRTSHRLGQQEEQQKGEAVSDSLNALGLAICNTGRKPTYCSRLGSSIVDLTFASPTLAAKIVGWEVLDTASLSDHLYIKYAIKEKTNEPPVQTPRTDIKKLDTMLKSNRIAAAVARHSDADVCAVALTNAIHECRAGTTSGNRPRKSVHWWSREISELRKSANHMRRVLQRKKKKQGPAACASRKKTMPRPQNGYSSKQ